MEIILLAIIFMVFIALNYSDNKHLTKDNYNIHLEQLNNSMLEYKDIFKYYYENDIKSDIEKYLSEIKYFSPLSFAEEKKLAFDIQNGKEGAKEDALEKLTKANLGKVVLIINEINSHLHPELINVGNYALIEAAKKYDSKSTFMQFARPYITKNIKKAIAENPSFKQPYKSIRKRICGTCLVNRKNKI